MYCADYFSLLNLYPLHKNLYHFQSVREDINKFSSDIPQILAHFEAQMSCFTESQPKLSSKGQFSFLILYFSQNVV
jgi:hypothetical protein